MSRHLIPGKERARARAAVIPKKESAAWRTEVLPKIQEALAAARVRLEQLAGESGDLELARILETDGAEDAAIVARDAQRAVEREIDGLEKALRLSQHHLSAAEAAEEMELQARRRARAEVLARDACRAADRIDGTLRQLAADATELLALKAALEIFQDITHVPGSRFAADDNVNSAVWATGRDLGVLLNRSRREALPRAKPLGVALRGLFGMFCPDLPAVPDVSNSDARTAAASGEPAAASAVNPNCGAFGGIVLDELVTGGKKYAPGDELPPELCLSWPLKNRLVLEAQRRVAFYNEAPAAAGAQPQTIQ